MINQTNPRCSFCHRVLYIFTWDNIRTACCNNQNCSLFKQPQNIQGVRFICHKCAYIKSPAELVNYGRYHLCRDCARKFDVQRENGRVVNVEDFVMVE
jgi:hypothetical protein